MNIIKQQQQQTVSKVNKHLILFDWKFDEHLLLYGKL